MKTLLNINLIFVLALVVGISCISYTQNDSKQSTQKTVVDNLSTKLEQKVLLNNEQVTKVKAILNSYFNNRSESSLNSAKQEIEKLFDTRQKAKYGIIKNEWWSSITSAVISK